MDKLIDILGFLYGIAGNKKLLPRHDCDIDVSDILEAFKCVRLGIEGVEAEEICTPTAAMTALLSFEKSNETISIQ